MHGCELLQWGPLHSPVGSLLSLWSSLFHACVCACACVHMHVHIHEEGCQEEMLPSIAFYLVYFFTCMGGCTHVQTCVGVHVMKCMCAMCLCVRRPGVGTLVFLDHFPPYALIWISNLNSKLANWLVWLASLLLRSPVSNCHALALQDSCPTHLGATWVLEI